MLGFHGLKPQDVLHLLVSYRTIGLGYDPLQHFVGSRAAKKPLAF